MVLKDYHSREIQFLNSYPIVLVSFPSGGCVGNLVDNRRNYQEYEYEFHLLHCHTIFTVPHFIDGERVLDYQKN